MRRLLIAVLLATAFASPAAADARDYSQGCNTRACMKRVCDSLKCRARVKTNYWERAQAALPAATRAMLARLRGCETRGIPFPTNYRYDGPHDGAYQYTPDTWHRAGGTGLAHQASPAEQDVRTARFYPAHRGEWACVA